MKRSKFLITLGTMIATPFALLSNKEEFDISVYLSKHKNVIASTGNIKSVFEYSSLQIPELKPKKVIDIWKDTGILLHRNDYFISKDGYLTRFQ